MTQRKVLSLSMSLESYWGEQHILKWPQEMNTHCRTQRDYTWGPRENEIATVWGWVTERLAFPYKNLSLNWPMYICTYWLNVYSGNSVGIILFSISCTISYLEHNYQRPLTLRHPPSVVFHINYKSEAANIWLSLELLSGLILIFLLFLQVLSIRSLNQICLCLVCFG